MTMNSYLRSCTFGVGAFGNWSAAATTLLSTSGLAYCYLTCVAGISQVFLQNHFNDIREKEECALNKLIRFNYSKLNF